MNRTELRIGNYISTIHANETYYAPIQKLDYQVCFYGESSQAYLNAPYSELEPIPITEQWLIDLGFKKHNNRYWDIYNEGTPMVLNIVASQLGYSATITDESIESDDKEMYLYEIKYIHQLQNLHFALFQNELILKDDE